MFGLGLKYFRDFGSNCFPDFWITVWQISTVGEGKVALWDAFQLNILYPTDFCRSNVEKVLIRNVKVGGGWRGGGISYKVKVCRYIM